jgi:hypothetical protein
LHIGETRSRPYRRNVRSTTSPRVQRLWRLVAALGLVAVSPVAFVAPTFVAARSAGDPYTACVERPLPAGYPVRDLDQPTEAEIDWFGGLLTCDWGPLEGEVYRTVFILGSTQQRALSSVLFGAGVAAAIASALGLARVGRASGNDGLADHRAAVSETR